MRTIKKPMPGRRMRPQVQPPAGDEMRIQTADRIAPPSQLAEAVKAGKIKSDGVMPGRPMPQVQQPAGRPMPQVQQPAGRPMPQVARVPMPQVQQPAGRPMGNTPNQMAGRPMKKGGKVSSASKRADGCAVRGKTRA